METLEIPGTANTPSVLFNTDKGLLIITGRSYPEYPELFYKDIINRIKDIKTNTLSVTIEMDYMNTSSTKMMLELLKFAKKITDSMIIIWATEEGDEDMEELAEHFMDCLEMEFEMRQFA